MHCFGEPPSAHVDDRFHPGLFVAWNGADQFVAALDEIYLELRAVTRLDQRRLLARFRAIDRKVVVGLAVVDDIELVGAGREVLARQLDGELFLSNVDRLRPTLRLAGIARLGRLLGLLLRLLFGVLFLVVVTTAMKALRQGPATRPSASFRCARRESPSHASSHRTSHQRPHHEHRPDHEIDRHSRREST
jgi:hypothetical protein